MLGPGAGGRSPMARGGGPVGADARPRPSCWSRSASVKTFSACESTSRDLRDRTLGGLALALARRLAPRVFVEDLGRVRIVVGDRVVEGSDVRQEGPGAAVSANLEAAIRLSPARRSIDCLWPDQRSRLRAQLAQPDRLLPSSGLRARLSRRDVARVRRPGRRNDLAGPGPRRQPKPTMSRPHPSDAGRPDT